jgi:aminodeoxyfutalosine synthase
MLRRVKSKIRQGKRLTREDALVLFSSDDVFTLGELASSVAARKNGGRAYYVRNLHVNPTNICVNRCRFCAFSRSKGEEGAYELSTGEIIKKIRGAMPVSEVHIVGGLHPDWPFGYYLGMLGRIRKSFPKVHIKGFTAVEVDYMRKISGLSLEEVLVRLRDAGLGSMPGGGAEIFSEPVRGRLCPEKITGSRWLEVMEAAHGAGLKSNATMLYGHIESYGDRVDHLMRLRELQDRTGGFQAFIPLSYHPWNTEMGGARSSGVDDLRTIAVSRLVLDNFPHIKAYWIMLGEKISQLSLLFGADDLDGTIVEERITHAAGAESGVGITSGELAGLIKSAGKRPVERDSYYRAVRRRAWEG